ncbi:MAG: Smr/MutS family protein [Deltaproteobacteria bacterium]|nr:Smr/MutS family protein [Deltaproteobacteria bacterium]
MVNKKESQINASAEFDNSHCDSDVVQMPIDGTLDLHTFSPGDVKSLVPDYLTECRRDNILEVRIVHGKGKGVLRRIVHSALEKLEYVESYHTAGHGQGSWGATIVCLKKNTVPNDHGEFS